MNPILYKYITDQINKSNLKGSKYVYAKKYRIVKINIKQTIVDFLLVFLGVISASFGLKGFLIPNEFFDGGAMGIAMLLSSITHIQLPYLIIIVNIPFVFLGYKIISKKFSVKTTIAITALAICTALMPYNCVTNDKLLAAIFGGFFLGSGIGLAVRGGCVIDGTEVLAIKITKHIALSIGDFIFIFNVLLFLIVAYLFQTEIALYSILTYLSASKTVDFVIEGIDEFTGVTIVSIKHPEIQNMIVKKLKGNYTIFKGKRSLVQLPNYLPDVDIIYTVVTRLELTNLKNEIEKIDPYAFITYTRVKEIYGGSLRKRILTS